MVHLLGMWWPPHQSLAAALHAGLFLSLAGATLYFFLQSLLEGPGFVPLGWKPVSMTSMNTLSIYLKKILSVTVKYFTSLYWNSIFDRHRNTNRIIFDNFIISTFLLV